jgi:hypothetical protein
MFAIALSILLRTSKVEISTLASVRNVSPTILRAFLRRFRSFHCSRDWCDFQKFLQLRQLAHVSRGRLEAAFQLANAALKFSA